MDRSAEITDGACHISKLSTEIFLEIIDYLPPASHFEFASTCKQIYACSSDVLKRHDDAFTKYRVVSDLDPTTVPKLLRSLFGYADPIPAWHVRSLEVWYDRKSWEEWTTVNVAKLLQKWEDSEPVTWEYVWGEWEDYLEPIAYENGTSEEMERGRIQIEEGYDGILKAVLIANCPRLRDVKFVPLGLSADFDDTTCLNWLELFIGDSVRGKYDWGPGLQSLRSVAVGVHSETWLDPPPRDQRLNPTEWGANTGLLQRLFWLPNIESIYFKGYVRDQLDDEMNGWDYEEFNPPRSSSLKHLFLDEYYELGRSFREGFIGAPAGLASVSFYASGDSEEKIKSVVESLGQHQSDTLESLMVYGTGHERSRWDMFRCDALQPFKALRNVSISIEAIQLSARNPLEERPDDESDNEMFERCFVESFPTTMETLILYGILYSEEVFITLEPSDEAVLESAIIKMITSGRYKQLKALFLEEVERSWRWGHGLRVEPRSLEIWFQEAISVGAEYGVDVYTLTNRMKKKHVIDFPEVYDKYSLQTGPWGKRPADWVFDVHQGFWVPPGCGKCGKCKVCLRYYTKYLWEEVDEAE